MIESISYNWDDILKNNPRIVEYPSMDIKIIKYDNEKIKCNMFCTEVPLKRFYCTCEYKGPGSFPYENYLELIRESTPSNIIYRLKTESRDRDVSADYSIDKNEIDFQITVLTNEYYADDRDLYCEIAEKSPGVAIIGINPPCNVKSARNG